MCIRIYERGVALGMASNNIRPLKLLGSLYLNDTHKIQTLGTLYIAQHHAFRCLQSFWFKRLSNSANASICVDFTDVDFSELCTGKSAGVSYKQRCFSAQSRFDA